MPDFAQYAQLGTTFMLAMAVVWLFSQFIKTKKNGNGNGNGNSKEVLEMKKLVEKIEGNHCSDIGGKLDELIRQGQESDRKHDRMVELLVEIKSKNATPKT